MAKHTQTICRPLDDELFECVWSSSERKRELQQLLAQVFPVSFAKVLKNLPWAGFADGQKYFFQGNLISRITILHRAYNIII